MSPIRIFINDEGVSPIVATLVLIVVAIIGAAAVALIMGSFSSNVSNQASAGDTSNSASTVIYVVGSETFDSNPSWNALNSLGNTFAANNTGVTIDSVGGGSVAGLAALEQGAADINVMTENPADNYAGDIARYNLKTYQIGESGICWVTYGNGETTIAKSQLVTAYSTGDLSNVQFGWPLDGHYATAALANSADKNVVMKYLGINSLAPTVKVESSRSALLHDIWWANSGLYPIGYVDSSYAFSHLPEFNILNIYDDMTGTAYPTTWDSVRNEIVNYQAGGSDPGTYPAGLIRPQVLVTKGSPSTLELAFIKYVQSPNNAETYSNTSMGHYFWVHVSQVGSHWRLTPPGI